MKKFIRELRRREVFRTAGLYVGICWILIEVGSVVLPVFGAPDWLFRSAIIAAVVGFPVMLVLAWLFDVTDKGISLQADPDSAVVEDLGAKKSDFVIIGVLLAALSISLFLNVKNEVPVVVTGKPVSVLIADIENTTGDPIFEGVVEHALEVGIEVAPNITTFDRGKTLNAELALAVAQQESIELVVSGLLEAAGDGYRINIMMTNAESGELQFELSEKARSRERVLQAIGDLALDVRKRLGDESVGEQQGTQAQTFVAASLESANAFVAGRRDEMTGQLDDALQAYQLAYTADTNSGRILSSLALLESDRGNADAAAAYWDKALPLLGTMTEREKLRTLGRHSLSVVHDDDATLNLYSEFVDKYPADVGARRNLAKAAFRKLDFRMAIDQAQYALSVYPNDPVTRAQLGLFAMAAGDWETASAAGERAISIDPDGMSAYLPIAMAALAQGQVEAAREVYQSVSTAGSKRRAASFAELGLADIDLLYGYYDEARSRLEAGIESDTANGDNDLAALKMLALAESYSDQNSFAEANAIAADASLLSDQLAVRVLAAMIFVKAGNVQSAQAVADALALESDTHSRAYSGMLNGLILEYGGASTDGLLSMRRALSRADLWLIRFEIGKAYFRAGNYPEALGELTTLRTREGEAASAFLDAMPTYRLLAELPYWTGRVQEELGLGIPARESYEDYLSSRSPDGALVQDARARVQTLD